MSAVRTFMLLAVILAVPASAGAVTVHDIIELTKAGLADDIIVELIEADRTVFTLDKDQILELKKAGVSKAVLLKMLRTGREFQAAPQEAAAPVLTEIPNPQPELALTPAKPAEATTTVVVPQVYYYVPFSIWGVPRQPGPVTPPAPFMDHRGFGRFINDGWVDRR